MKLLTLNTHSLIEENSEQKLQWFVEGILRERPDLIALQEVNQTARGEEAPPSLLEGQIPISDCVKVRRDNYAARVASCLRQAGIPTAWAWLPIKRGFEIYDEGVAILSLNRKIAAIDRFPISRDTDYRNWRTRAVLGVQPEGRKDWFYSVHMGWWGDEPEGFAEQWQMLTERIAEKRAKGPVWLLGDFNAPASVSGESYDKIRESGWFDTYESAQEKDDGITVVGTIDGWRGKTNREAGMRLDYIWCSQKKEILTSKVVFNGKREPVISDHFGVMIEWKEDADD